MRKAAIVVLATVCAMVIGALPAGADVPGLINYQGYLTDPDGVPISGVLDMEFTLWDDPTDTDPSHLKWTETWDTVTEQVEVSDGYYSVLLGSYQSFGEVFEDNSALWLQVEVDAEVMTARKRIVAVTYALSAKSANEITFMITESHIDDGAVTVSKIATGAVTGDKISADAVGSSHIASGAVGSDQIDDGAIQGADIAADALGATEIADIYVLNTGDTMTGKLKVERPSGGAAAEIGNGASATGWNSVAMGHNTTASGFSSIAMGQDTTASGPYSTAMGNKTTASGEYSTAMGIFSDALNDFSTAMGYSTTASGVGSTAMGGSIAVEGFHSFGIGLGTLPSTITADHTMAIMGGKVGIRTTSPDSPLTVNGDVRVDGGGMLRFCDDPGGGGSDRAYLSYYARSGEATTLRIAVENDSDDHISLVPSGNVGIGTTGPVQKLDVRGGVYVSGNTGMGTTSPGSHRLSVINDVGEQHGSSLWAENTNSGGIAIWAKNSSSSASDTTLLVENKGSGPLIKGFGSSGDVFHVENNGQIWGHGDLWIDGTKYFIIDHPLHPEDMKLAHATLEGPEAAVFYRGEARLTNSSAVVKLPDYFEALTRKQGRTVQLTCKGGASLLYIVDNIRDGTFEVRTTADGDPDQAFYWEVKAVRADVDPVQVERPKEVGL